MLAPVLDPLHGPAAAFRQKRDQQVLGIDVAFDTKATTHVERQATHARFRQPQHRGCLAAHPVHDLGRRPDGHSIGARIVLRNDTPAFHGQRAVAVMMEAALEPARRARQSRLGIAPTHGEGANQVGAEPVMDERRALAQRRLGVDHRK